MNLKISLRGHCVVLKKNSALADAGKNLDLLFDNDKIKSSNNVIFQAGWYHRVRAPRARVSCLSTTNQRKFEWLSISSLINHLV